MTTTACHLGYEGSALKQLQYTPDDCDFGGRLVPGDEISEMQLHILKTLVNDDLEDCGATWVPETSELIYDVENSEKVEEKLESEGEFGDYIGQFSETAYKQTIAFYEDEAEEATFKASVSDALSELGYEGAELSDTIIKITTRPESQVILASLENGQIESRETLDGLLASQSIKPVTASKRL